MVTRPRARGPDRKTTPLMRSLGLLNSEDYQQRNRAFGRVLEICGDQVPSFVTRSLNTHAPKYTVRYAVFSDFENHRDWICQDVWVFVFLHGHEFHHQNYREFDLMFSRYLSATSAFKTREHLAGLERIARRFEPLDNDDDDGSDEEEERRPKRLFYVGRPHGLEDEVFGSDHINILMEAISRLRPFDQELINRRYFSGYTYEELTQQTGKSYAALRTKFNRIRAKLRTILQEMLASTD